MELTETDARVVFYDAFGQNLHEFSVTKNAHQAL